MMGVGFSIFIPETENRKLESLAHGLVQFGL
jgi:hypothetical protein